MANIAHIARKSLFKSDSVGINFQIDFKFLFLRENFNTGKIVDPFESDVIFENFYLNLISKASANDFNDSYISRRSVSQESNCSETVL